ncbi:MAG: NADP-dependent oxidoreductase [Haloglomus sp.]
MAENRQWRLAKRPTGEPDRDTFELVETEIPAPDEGEVLVRTVYQSVDPYMRGRMRDAESYAEPWAVGEPMRAGVVGEVVESRHSGFDEGDVVTGDLLWAEYATADGDELRRVDPDLAPISTAVGVLGMPGVTAYYGFTEKGDPEPGDAVVVSAAAGAVGSVVGQLARVMGCEVVGIAGADEKCDWLTDELGFDAAVNYETEDVRAGVREAVGGVDVYFDNVGGPVTDAVWPTLDDFARVVACGQISLYNATELPTGPRKLTDAVQKRLRIEGFIVSDYDRWGHALQRLGGLIASDDLRYREHVVEGFENAPDAFLGLFEGVNIGKTLVKVGEEP